MEPPLLSLGGGWAVHRTDGYSEVTLDHEFEVEEESGELPELVHRVIDEYSRRELEALRLSCERLALLLRQHSTMSPAGTNAKEA